MWIDQLCRLCAQVSEVLFPIFEKNGDKPHLDLKIRKCLSLIISEEDCKPKHVCYNCATKLEDYHEFLETCLNSDYKFESILFTSQQKIILDPLQAAQSHDGVIVIGKSDELPARDCQDILLMVELKNLEDFKQQNDILTDKVFTQNIPQSVLRHPENFHKKTDDIVSSSMQKIKKPFPCAHCQKSFMRRSSLNAHMSIHTQIRPFSCDQCDRSFAVRWNLTIHQRIHSGVFSCEFCGKNFPVKGKLERHTRTHTGERPYGCDFPGCDKAFSDKRNLEAHARTHSEERPFVCTLCGKAFRSRSHLTDHRRVHSTDAPFTCHSCGKSFKWKTNLTIHLRSHTGEKSSCPDCTKQFSRTSLLTKHRRLHHLGEQKTA